MGMKSSKQKFMIGISALAAFAFAGVVYAGSQVADNSIYNLNAEATTKIIWFAKATNKMANLNSFEKKTTLSGSGTTTGAYAYISRDTDYIGETVTLDDTINFVTITPLQSGSNYMAGLRFKVFAKNIQKAQAYWTITKSTTDSTVVTPTSLTAKVRYSSDGSLNADPLSGNGIGITPTTQLTKSDLTTDCNVVEFTFVITATQSFAFNFFDAGISWSC
jgi:hypothetical protein